MRQYIFILLAAMIGFSCAGTKKIVFTPVGSWDYLVVGTPNGDVEGTMILTEMEDVFSGKFISEFGDSELENVYYAEGKMTCQFYIQGMEMAMTGQFEGETFTGNIDAGQMGSFPITANRVVDK